MKPQCVTYWAEGETCVLFVLYYHVTWLLIFAHFNNFTKQNMLKLQKLHYQKQTTIFT